MEYKICWQCNNDADIAAIECSHCGAKLGNKGPLGIAEQRRHPIIKILMISGLGLLGLIAILTVIGGISNSGKSTSTTENTLSRPTRLGSGQVSGSSILSRQDISEIQAIQTQNRANIGPNGLLGDHVFLSKELLQKIVSTMSPNEKEAMEIYYNTFSKVSAFKVDQQKTNDEVKYYMQCALVNKILHPDDDLINNIFQMFGSVPIHLPVFTDEDNLIVQEGMTKVEQMKR